MDTLKIDTLAAAQEAAQKEGLVVREIACIRPRVYVADVVGSRVVVRFPNFEGKPASRILVAPGGHLKAGTWCALATVFTTGGDRVELPFPCVPDRDEMLL